MEKPQWAGILHFQTDWNPLPMISLELTMVRKTAGSALSVQMLLYIHQPGDDAVCGRLVQRLAVAGLQCQHL